MAMFSWSLWAMMKLNAEEGQDACRVTCVAGVWLQNLANSANCLFWQDFLRSCTCRIQLLGYIMYFCV